MRDILAVDTMRLTSELSEGIREIYGNWFNAPTEYMLTMPVCGLASVAIAKKISGLGIRSRRTTVRNLPFNTQTHDYSIHYDDPRDPLRIDATYCQFYHSVGLHWKYESFTDSKILPADKILTFRESERAKTVQELADFAIKFQSINSSPHDERIDLKSGKFVGSSRAEITNAFDQVWGAPEFALPDSTIRPDSQLAGLRATFRKGEELGRHIGGKSVRILPRSFI